MRWSVAVMLLLAIACAVLVIVLLASGALAPKPTPPGAAGPSAAPASPSEPPWIGEPGGLQYKDTVVGEGDPAADGDTVDVLYVGRLTDGTVFDSNQDREAPFSFTLGRGEVIRGWDEGVGGMRVGGERELKIPPRLGYGAAGSGRIPPGATLEFTVELLAIH